MKTWGIGVLGLPLAHLIDCLESGRADMYHSRCARGVRDRGGGVRVRPRSRPVDVMVL
jgi:hypothetical protein